MDIFFELLIRRPIVVIRLSAYGMYVFDIYGGALSGGDAAKPTQEAVTCEIQAVEH